MKSSSVCIIQGCYCMRRSISYIQKKELNGIKVFYGFKDNNTFYFMLGNDIHVM